MCVLVVDHEGFKKQRETKEPGGSRGPAVPGLKKWASNTIKEAPLRLFDDALLCSASVLISLLRFLGFALVIGLAKAARRARCQEFAHVKTCLHDHSSSAGGLNSFARAASILKANPNLVAFPCAKETL